MQVSYVAMGSAAERQGVMVGDEVLSINGRPPARLSKGWVHLFTVSASSATPTGCKIE